MLRSGDCYTLQQCQVTHNASRVDTNSSWPRQEAEYTRAAGPRRAPRRHRHFVSGGDRRPRASQGMPPATKEPRPAKSRYDFNELCCLAWGNEMSSRNGAMAAHSPSFRESCRTSNVRQSRETIEECFAAARCESFFASLAWERPWHPPSRQEPDWPYLRLPKAGAISTGGIVRLTACRPWLTKGRTPSLPGGARQKVFTGPEENSTS